MNASTHTHTRLEQVLIVGLKGVGIETAKNLILAGPGAVTLWDDHPTEVGASVRA